MSVRPQPASRRPGVRDDTLVLGDRPLRPSVLRAATSRFRDLVWDLTPALHHQHHRKLVLNFASMPEQFRLVAKELYFALLAGEPTPGRRRPHIATIRGSFSAMLAFLQWADRRGVMSLGALTAEDLNAYQEHLLKQRGGKAGGAAGWRQKHRHAVRLFWIYRGGLATDRLSFDPGALDAWDDESCWAGRRENRTERIPEAVLGPLLGWALRWVDDFSDDVARAYQEWLALSANSQANRIRRDLPPTASGEVRVRLEALLARYRAERRPLPRVRGDRPVPARVPQRDTSTWVNASHLARELNCAPAALREAPMVALLEEAIAEVGLSDGTWLRAEVHGRINGRPWRGPIAYEEVPELARLLQTACYILIAYLSGMRDGEVKHLRRGCLATRRDNTGRAYRWTVTSQAFKGEANPEGVEATWVVGEPVGRAVGVLERLQPSHQHLLFARLVSSRYFHRGSANDATSTPQTRRDLEAFVDWVNTYCDANGLTDLIPLVAGQRWHLTTRQFRRTLAWFIARRPGGVIAGAIAYRHHSVQLFEGYAGTSRSGFRAEVEAEQALERGERLLAMVEGYEHRRLGGPAAEEARVRLEELRRHAYGFAGTVVTDQRRLQLIMRRHDPSVFPGRFVTCVFNPDKALCLRPSGDRHGPVLPDCRPLDCRNVALTPSNLAAWREQLARLDQALAPADVLAPYLRHRLTEQRDRVARFLAEHDHPCEAPA
jgi:integrase